MTDRDRLGVAFRALRKKGYLARHRIKDGNISGFSVDDWYYVLPSKLIYYSVEDDRAFDRSGSLVEELLVSWRGDLEEVRDAFLEQGLEITLDETDIHKVRVSRRMEIWI